MVERVIPVPGTSTRSSVQSGQGSIIFSIIFHFDLSIEHFPLVVLPCSTLPHLMTGDTDVRKPSYQNGPHPLRYAAAVGSSRLFILWDPHPSRVSTSGTGWITIPSRARPASSAPPIHYDSLPMPSTENLLRKKLKSAPSHVHCRGTTKCHPAIHGPMCRSSQAFPPIQLQVN